MFKLEKMHKQIQKSAKAFAAGEFEKEICQEMDHGSQFRENIRKKAGDTGFIGIQFPEAYSGGDLGAVEDALIAKTFCRLDSTAGCSLMFSTPGADFLVKSTSEELKKKYLPDLAAGIMVSAEAFTETYSDPGFSQIAATAEKSKSGWTINGSKINVINGNKAGLYFVLCQTDSNPGIFLVDSETEGITVDKKKETLGLRMIERADVTFTNCTVPEANLLSSLSSNGKELQAYTAALQVQIAAMATGIAKGAYDRTMKYIKLREQFGKKLAEFQISRHKIADMATRIELAYMMTLNAAHAIDTNSLTPAMGAMAKQCATENAMMVTDEAVQLLGGYGYSSEYEVERYYRDAKVLELLGGSKAHLKNTIADKEIGKINRK